MIRIACLGILALTCACSMNFGVQVGQQRAVPADSTTAPVDTVTVVDSLFFLTRLDSLLDINDVRNTLGRYLMRDLKRILDNYFGMGIGGYGTRAGYAFDRIQWSGDWLNWIQLKIRVLMLASGQLVNMTLRWEFDKKSGIWELHEITHEEK